MIQTPNKFAVPTKRMASGTKATERSDFTAEQNIVGHPDAPAKTAVGVSVLMVVDGLFPAVGGAEIQSVKLANELKLRGADVEFIAPLLDPPNQHETAVEGFPLERLRYPRIKGLGAVFMNLRFLVFLLRNHHRFNAIHIHTMGTLTASAGMICNFLKPVVISKVSGYYEFSDGVLRDSNRGLLNRFMTWGIRRIDHIHTISRQTAEILKSRGFSDRQICLIPNGVDTKAQVPQTTERSQRMRVIGYTGRVRQVKGVSVLIEGFHEFLIRNPSSDLRLDIAGDGVQFDEVKSLVKTLGLGDRVRLLGFVEDITAFLAELDVYVQPSFAEGLPNSVLEAMSASLPVIATDIGGNQDLVESGVNGRLFPAGDSGALARILEEFDSNQPDALKVMGEMSRLKVLDQYGLDTVTDKLLKLYTAADN